MSARFAPQAVLLAGLAGRLLGWRPDEFWAATPAELAAVLAPPTPPLAGAPLTRAAALTRAAPLTRAECARLMELHP